MVQELVNVQPMTGISVGGIFKVRHLYEVWMPTFLFFPRKTIFGTWTIGYSYYRAYMQGNGNDFSPGKNVTDYTTKKEMFIIKLKGDA